MTPIYGIAHDNNDHTYIHPYCTSNQLQTLIDYLQYDPTYMQHIAQNSDVWHLIGHSKH